MRSPEVVVLALLSGVTTWMNNVRAPTELEFVENPLVVKALAPQRLVASLENLAGLGQVCLVRLALPNPVGTSPLLFPSRIYPWSALLLSRSSITSYITRLCHML